MSDNKKIWYATASKLKFNEALSFCKSKGLTNELLQEETELFEVQTRDPKDIRTVALHKGKQAWDRIGNPVLIEYTGLFLNKYGNFPGSLTKHVFKGIGYRGMFRLVDSGDNAVFVSFLTYVDEYGFDQIFVPQGFDLSYEELKKEPTPAFEQSSYRLSALHKFVQHLKKTNH
jgi:XTP/dITP diphosphohydrolase